MTAGEREKREERQRGGWGGGEIRRDETRMSCVLKRSSERLCVPTKEHRLLDWNCVFICLQTLFFASCKMGQNQRISKLSPSGIQG